jgi:hypothetical protein
MGNKQTVDRYFTFCWKIGGGGRGEHVRDGQELRRTGRKPVNWMVPRRRGNGPDTTFKLWGKISKLGQVATNQMTKRILKLHHDS